MIELNTKYFGKCNIESFPDFSLTNITTKKLLIRPPHINDFHKWNDVRLKNQNRLQAFEPSWSDEWNTEDSFKSRFVYQKREWTKDRSYCFLIFSKDTNELIGGINVNNVIRGSAQFASLGYWIDKDHEGQKLMSEALDSMIVFCFETLKLERLNIAILEENTKSKNLVERFSFEYEGTAKKYAEINGTRQDHLLYGLNKQDI